MQHKKLDVTLEIVPGELEIKETLEKFEVMALGDCGERLVVELDVLAASNLRNKLSYWLNTKRSREMRDARKLAKSD